MTSDSSENPLDADPPATDAAPLDLPRLQIIHLMLWMATTAVAFLPYQLGRQTRERISPNAAAISQTIPSMAMGATYGVAAGGYLFVAAMLLVWKRKGYRFRLQPGHWFAFEGVGQWVLSVATWLVLFAFQGGILGIMILRWLFGLAFFACYIWLAVRAQDPLRWRWTFAAMALAPFAVWLGRVDKSWGIE